MTEVPQVTRSAEPVVVVPDLKVHAIMLSIALGGFLHAEQFWKGDVPVF
jgi:hypothetical protein